MTVIGSDFIFVHVPKNAGKAVSRRLGGVTRGVASHAALSEIDPGLRADRFCFGFVRNPWDRLVSAYVFITTKTVRPGDDAAHRAMATRLGFKRWLLETEFYLAPEHHHRPPGLPPIQQRSQMHWLDGCDFIGRMENLNADFRQIESRIERSKSLLYRLRFRGDITRSNGTKRQQYQAYYDAESADFVARHFAPEIARFGYQFEELAGSGLAGA